MLGPVTTSLSLLTWNLNSVRARLDLVLEYLESCEPDLVCFQETKVQNNLFPKVPFMEMGYEVHLHGTKGYAGVATLSKSPLQEIQRGFAQAPDDKHPRILAANWQEWRVYNLYAPNGTALDSPNFPYKLEWYARLAQEVQSAIRDGQELILCGDFNIIPDDRDLWDPKAWEGSLQCTPQEREALSALLADTLQDCFRARESEGGFYSYFDYQRGAWPKRHGIRIDHVYATPEPLAANRSVTHDLEPRGWPSTSDHVPVLARFERS